MFWKRKSKDLVKVLLPGDREKEKVRVRADKFKALIDKGTAKRVYKVLIKGPWPGIKEDYWELSDENVQSHVYNGEVAYAICAFEDGQPNYSLVKKGLWNYMDDIASVMSDPSLSQGEKLTKIKRFAESED